MTNRERVLASLNHRQPDKTPYKIAFTQVAHAKMAQYFGDPDFADKIGNCFTGLSLNPKDSWREVQPDLWQDSFGVQWNRAIDKDIGVVSNRLVTLETIHDYQFPDPDEPSRFEAIQQALQKRGDQFLVANLGFSFFERAWTLAGMENILMWMITDPEKLEAFLDRILDYNLRLIANACRYDIDAMMFGDDWGQQNGLIMGPGLWRQFFKPRLAQMYGAAKAKGKFVFIHSCGKVDEVFPDLIEIGLDVFNPFQPEVIDVFAMKRQWGDRLSFFGGISTQRTLPYGTPAQVKDEVRRLVAEIGRNGGYIAAPAHDIPADAKAENIAAMLDVLQHQ